MENLDAVAFFCSLPMRPWARYSTEEHSETESGSSNHPRSASVWSGDVCVF